MATRAASSFPPGPIGVAAVTEAGVIEIVTAEAAIAAETAVATAAEIVTGVEGCSAAIEAIAPIGRAVSPEPW